MMRISPARVPLVFLLGLVCLLAPPPVCAQDSTDGTDGQRLREDFAAVYRAKNWSKAIEVGLKLEEFVPDDSTNAYNLACVYSLNGDVDRAGDWLIKVASRGFSQRSLFETDTDLDNVRALTAYRDALGVVKSNQQKQFESVKKRFLRHAPLVILPPDHDPDRAYPMIVALHGYGGRANHMVGAWEPIADQMGAILVVPQAVHEVSAAGGYSWLRPGSTSADEIEYVVRLTVDMVTAEFKIDKKRTILTGFSQGGFAAYAVGARQPYMFTGVIPMAGGYIPAIDAPAKAVGERKPRFYFMVGEHDRVVDQFRKAVDDFAAAGFDAKLRVYPGAGHTFPRQTLSELREALEYVLEQ